MRALAILGAALLSAPLVSGAAPQQLAMMRAEWGDLETWSHVLQESRQTELGLGLHAAGPAGTTYLAFTGRLSARNPRTPPREIGVQAAIGRLSNPTVVRRPSLLFLLDAKEAKPLQIDLSSQLTVDDPNPGGSVENAVTTMRAEDFVRLASAKTLSADVLGFETTLREDQIAAMREFAGRLHLVSPR
jgi:hypothetical protein